MSSFNKASNRKSNILNNSKVKKHVQSFYKIMDEIESLAVKIKELNIEITEENVNSVASDIMGRSLDSMEQFVLLGKLGKYVK
jgi:hypothetical protein